MAAKRAFYLLQGSHLRNPVLNKGLKNYDLIVCNPSVPVADIREHAPDADLLAYFCAHTIPHYGPESEFYESMRDEMDNHLLRTVSDDAKVGHIAPAIEVTDSYGNYELMLTFDAYMDYAAWINENVQEGMGIYLDECWGVPPNSYIERTGLEPRETGDRWEQLARYFVDRLHGATIVGNVGAHPEYAPEGLTSITIEASHIERMSNAHYAHFYEKVKQGGGRSNIAWGLTTDPKGLENLFAAGEILI